MLSVTAQQVAHIIETMKLIVSSTVPSFRTRCQRWSVSWKPARLTLWSVSDPMPRVSLMLLTAPMCLPSCSTSGCLRWCEWSVMVTLSACLSRASSPGQCHSVLVTQVISIFFFISLFVLQLYIHIFLSFSFFSHNPVLWVGSSFSLYDWSQLFRCLMLPAEPKVWHLVCHITCVLTHHQRYVTAALNVRSTKWLLNSTSVASDDHHCHISHVSSTHKN